MYKIIYRSKHIGVDKSLVQHSRFFDRVCITERCLGVCMCECFVITFCNSYFCKNETLKYNSKHISLVIFLFLFFFSFCFILDLVPYIVCFAINILLVFLFYQYFVIMSTHFTYMLISFSNVFLYLSSNVQTSSFFLYCCYRLSSCFFFFSVSFSCLVHFGNFGKEKRTRKYGFCYYHFHSFVNI